MNDVIARLSFVDDLYVEVPVPVDVKMVQESGEINPVHFDGFFITILGHYTLYLDDVVCLELTDEKRQGIRAPSSAAFWSIEWDFVPRSYEAAKKGMKYIEYHFKQLAVDFLLVLPDSTWAESIAEESQAEYVFHHLILYARGQTLI